MVQPARLVLSDSSAEDIANALAAMGIHLGSDQIITLLDIVSLIGDPDDVVENTDETGNVPARSFSLILPNTHYHINVKRAVLAVSAALLDALATAGLASASLALSGYAKQGLAKLDTASGEYCCLVHCSKLHEQSIALQPENIQTMLFGKPCPFLELHCRLMKNSNCTATPAAIAGLFNTLLDKGALQKDGGGWSMVL